MGQKEKLIKRLKSKPKEFSFEEAAALLHYLSYSRCDKGKTGGSRVIFTSEGKAPILLHKPHPRKELLEYQMKLLMEILEQEGFYMKNTIRYGEYVGSVEFSEKDGVFFGRVMGIRALISYEGTTASELLKDFHEAVDDYLALCEAEGKEPERAYKGSFNVRIPPELHKQAVICAAARDISLNRFVEQAIQKETYNELGEMEGA